jgi:D-cysteine desulfhydrase
VEKIEVVSAGTDMAAAMQKVAEDLDREGRRGYVIPGGGSNPIGATGYVACAQEIQEQLFDKGLCIDRLVVASGSTGTHAGLLTGFYGCNMNIPIVGIGVSRDPGDQDPLVYDLVQKTAERVGVNQSIPMNAVGTFGDYWRPKYSVPNKKMVEAVNMMAKTEGILLDPVYTGKAMAGLIDLSRRGYFRKGEKVLFVHTGGSPGLYAYIRPILGLEEVAD